MKSLGIYCLAFAILWVSTWMVTDIHNWSTLEQPHPIFFTEHTAHQTITSESDATDDHQSVPHCRSGCSYDHGGHMGQTLPAIVKTPSFASTQSIIFSHYSAFWHFRIIPPKIRPPIVA